MATVRAQHDSAWKDILDNYLPQAIKLCFPDIYKEINWDIPWESLDKELQSITKDGKTGQRLVDKLVRVHLKNGSRAWLLLHIEIEQNPRQSFPERMFVYGTRLFDKYRCPIISCAIITGDHANKDIPNFYEIGFGGSRLRQDFLLCKLTDFEKDREKLEHSKNPFATVILFHLDALKAKKQRQAQRFQTKYTLVKRLYQRGLDKKAIVDIFRFLDFSIALSEPFELKFKEEIYKIEENKKMPYLSTIERLGRQEGLEQGLKKGRQEGRQKGLEEGLQQGEAAVLIRLLMRRFGSLPAAYISQIKQAKLDRLRFWEENFFNAKTLREVFQNEDPVAA